MANVNDLPTGSVTITGTPTQGQTLTVSNTLADVDGIPTSGTGAIAYQWNAGGTAITGATGSSLVLTQAQVGQAISVTARYTDNQGTVENVTSNATAAVVNVNDPPTGTVVITGIPKQGQTLTASNTLADLDGIPSLGTGAITYQWNAGGVPIIGATGSSLLLSPAQVGQVITVTARYTDNQGWAEAVTSAVTAAVVNSNGEIPNEPRAVSGVVLDGYVAGASIFLDRNGNGLPDANEDTGLRTDATGNFSGTVAGAGKLFAIGGTSVDTGLTNILILSNVQGAAVITPVTTLVQELIGSKGLGTTQAQAKVALAFSVGGADLLNFDPLSADDAALGLAVQKANVQLALTAALAGSASAAVAGIANLTATATAPLDLTNVATLSQALAGLNLSTEQLAAIGQANAAVRASTNLAALAQAQKAALLGGLPASTDLVAPSLATAFPAAGSQNVAVGADLVFTFSEAIQRGSGSIALRTADGTLVEVFGANSPAVTIQGNALTLNPSADLKPATGYVVVFEPNAVTDLAGNAFTGAQSAAFSTLASPGDVSPPLATKYSPADGARSVATNSNLTLTFNELIQPGTGTIRLKTADGTLVETFTADNATVSGSTLTLNPTADLRVFTKYVVELAAGAVKDLAGNASAASSSYDFQTASLPGLYHMFVVAFGAAPGVTYMGQLAEAHTYFSALPPRASDGAGWLQQVVEIFTTKAQFTSVYPETLSNRDLAVRMTNTVIKTSATDAARLEAVNDIEAALNIGWSRGKMLYTVFGNLANKPLTDPTWGATAKQFQNQLAVARYFTEALGVDTTDLARLRAVLEPITPNTDASTTDKIVQIIGAVPPG